MNIGLVNNSKISIPIGRLVLSLNIWVLIYVLASMAGIYFESFSVVSSVLGASVVTLVLNLLFSFGNSGMSFRSDLVSATCLLLLCGVTNWSGSFYPTAGQDPGLYNILSVFYLKNGAPWGFDPIWQFLDSASKEYYNTMGGAKYPGLVGLGEDRYTSNFYPAFPSVLSLFSFFFGKYNGGYGQSFLGFLAVFNFYSILKHAKVGNLWAFFVSVLFALNPQRIFFSGFPCSETMAISIMFFSLLCLYLAVKNNSTSLFVFSAIGWTAFYLTRMNFYFYFPILVLILGFCNLQSKGTLKIRIWFYLTLVFGLFYLSHTVYAKHFPELLWTYSPILIPLWGDKWQQFQSLTLLAVFVASLIFVGISDKGMIKALIQKSSDNYSRLVWLGVGIIAVLFLDRLHAISHTAQYASQDMNAIWKFINQGYKIGLYHMSLVGVVFSIGPIVAALFCLSLWKSSSLNNFCKTMVGALIYFGLLFSAKAFYVNYYYYYSRYFYGEIIPLIYIVLGLAGYQILTDLIKNKLYQRILMGLTLVLAGLFAYPQWNGYEGPSKTFFQEIESKTSTQDLVLVDSKNLWPRNEVLPGLIFFLERKVFVLKSLEDLKLESVRNLISKFEKVFVLTQNQPQQEFVPIEYDFQIYTGSRRHLFEGLNSLSETKYSLPKVLPNKSVVKRATYYFFQLNQSKNN